MASSNAYDCILARDWAGLVAAVEEDPTTAQYKTVYGTIPLHVASGNLQAPVYALRALLTAWPLGAMTKNDFGSLPLHWAAIAHNIPAADILLSAFPRALVEKDDLGQKPKDIARLYGSHELEAVLVEAERVMTVRRGWAILRSLVWTLMLHSRAVVRANHPDVLFAQGYFNVLD